MNLLKVACIVMGFLFVPSVAVAHTKVIWDRNTEIDMKHYNVYACPGDKDTPCVPDTSVSPEAIVLQPSVATDKPTYNPTGSIERWYGVTAEDTFTNESGLSNVGFFDSQSPADPKNLDSQ